MSNQSKINSNSSLYSSLSDQESIQAAIKPSNQTISEAIYLINSQFQQYSIQAITQPVQQAI
jgi:hypothetical protein